MNNKKIFVCIIYIGFLTSLVSLANCRPLATDFLQKKVCAVSGVNPYLRFMEWPSRKAELHQLKYFTVHGSLEAKSPQQEDMHVKFRWHQAADTYQLELLNDAGQAAAVVRGRGEQTILRIQGKRYAGKRAEELFRKYTGVSLPLSYVSSWLKGIPQESKQNERVLNQTKHLLTLHQAGWFLRYLKYHRIFSRDLPTQIALMKNGCYVRILISHWQL